MNSSVAPRRSALRPVRRRGLTFSFTFPAVGAVAPKRYANAMLYGSTNGFDFASREDLEYEKTYKDYGINPMPVI